MRSGKARQVSPRLHVLRVQLQGALKIPARAFRLSTARFEHAEIVPAIGVVRFERKCPPLLGDGFFQLARLAQHLGESRMHGRIVRLQFSGLAQFSLRAVEIAGLGVRAGKLAVSALRGWLNVHRLAQVLDRLGIFTGIQFDSRQAKQRLKVLGIELQSAAKLSPRGAGLHRIDLTSREQRRGQAGMGFCVFRADSQLGAKLLLR